MKLIKNISPIGVKINISVIKTDGQSIAIDLSYGDSILVNDIGIETKSIIIQNKKRNIDILDDYPNGLTAYQKYSHEELNFHSLPECNFESEKTKKEEYAPPEVVNDYIEPVIKTEESSSIIEQVVNKGGRPKGSNRKPLTKAQLKKRNHEQYMAKKKKKKEEEKNKKQC